MVNHPSTAREADEIDLFELVAAVWAQKALIIGCIVVATGVAAAYAFLSKPVYEARLYLQPPTLNDIADFNYGRTREAELTPYTIGDVYSVFTRNLQGESLRRAFFTDVYLPSLSEEQRQGSQDALYSDYLNTLTIGGPTKDLPDRYSVAVYGSDPTQATAWVKAFADKAGAQAETEMITNVEREGEVRARNIGQQITTLQETETRVRTDAISRLKEALNVAQAIGLENPPIITGSVAEEVSAVMDGQLTYMRGTKALNAEIKNLEERKTDDPFIANLRALQIKQSFYQALQVSPDTVAVFRQDGPINVPDRPIKPRKGLILVGGVIAGGILGLLFALGRFFIAQRRKSLHGL